MQAQLQTTSTPKDELADEKSKWPAASLSFAGKVLRALARLAFNIQAHGTERIPARGGALLIANSLSRLDRLFLCAAIDRPIRFATDKDHRFAGTFPPAGSSPREWTACRRRTR